MRGHIVRQIPSRRRVAALASSVLFTLIAHAAAAADDFKLPITPQQAAEGWIALFDGQTLYGWQPTSRADWKVEDGEIRVSSGEQGWLMTTSEFANYELHVEFKAPPTTNSGVFVRTPLDPKDPSTDCIELNIAPKDNPFPTASLVGRVKVSTKPEGYSVQSPSGETEKRRTGGPAKEVDAWDGAWHAFDVALEGPAVRISLDGVLLTTFVMKSSDPTAPTRGRIGLQFREGPVAFRTIRLKPRGLSPMLNGKDLAGWNTALTRDAKFTLVDTASPVNDPRANELVAPRIDANGAVVKQPGAEEGTPPALTSGLPPLRYSNAPPADTPGVEKVISMAPDELHVTGGPGQLETDASYGDFVMQLEAIVDGANLNSGVFFRSIPRDFANGYECQINNAIKEGDPTKPVDAGTGAIYRRTTARRVVSKDHQWLDMTIVAAGPHMATWVDGYQMTDFTDGRPPDPNPRKGLRVEPGTISLQAHDQTTNLRFRNLQIAELPETINHDDTTNTTKDK